MENFERLQLLFHQCAEIVDAGERESLVESLRHGRDAELVPRLVALLEADRAQTAAARTEGEESPVRPPELLRFGPYRAERILGRGGMGIVYFARRADGQFEQSAALKVISASMDPVVGQQYFLRERQILAGLHHPGIALLFDGGVGPDGSPYFVMEYVEGQRLDDYCGNQRLNIAGRIELLRKICDIVAYAHRNLVIHRDLKPSNILVNEQGLPKLLDFGTARLIQEDLAPKDHSATQGLLTPRYASPEQLRNGRVSTATDIFSLGVMLAELLTGRWPFGDPSSKVDALRRAVEDVQPLAIVGHITAEHAGLCSASLQSLRQQIQGDLSAIVSHCLESNPEHRYRSVDELSEDLRRYLAGEPVGARRQTAMYRFRKFVRRHSLPVSASALAFLILLGLGLYALRQARQAEREADRAVLSRLAFDQMMSSLAPNSSLADVAKANQAFLARPNLDPALRADLLVSGASVAFAAADFSTNIAMLRQSASEARQLGDAFGEALALSRLAMTLGQTGEMEESEAAARQALALASGSSGRAGQVVRINALQAILFGAAWGRGIPPDVDKFIDRALVIPDDPFLRPAMVLLYENIASIRGKQGREREELAALETGLKYFREEPGGDTLILESWRWRLVKSGDYAGAERFARERLERAEKDSGPAHLLAAHARLNLAKVLVLLNRRQEALDASLRALRTYERAGPEGGAPIDSLLFSTLAFVYAESGEPKAAERWVRQSIQLKRGMDAAKDPRVGENYLQLGYVLRLQSRFGEALEALTRARDIYTAAGPAYAKRVKEAADQFAMAEARDPSPYPNHLR